MAIARSVSRYPKSDAPDSKGDLTWAEIETNVSHDTAATIHLKPGAAAPRRRFPLPSDRAYIRHIRQRLTPIWMEAQNRMGNEEAFERAERCGNLPSRNCGNCNTTFSEASNPRYNCRGRLHPLCMGTQVHKPLWNAREALEAEKNLDIAIIQLGFYDIGEDPFF